MIICLRIICRLTMILARVCVCLCVSFLLLSILRGSWFTTCFRPGLRHMTVIRDKNNWRTMGVACNSMMMGAGVPGLYVWSDPWSVRVHWIVRELWGFGRQMWPCAWCGCCCCCCSCDYNCIYLVYILNVVYICDALYRVVGFDCDWCLVRVGVVVVVVVILAVSHLVWTSSSRFYRQPRPHTHRLLRGPEYGKLMLGCCVHHHFLQPQ